MPLSSIVIVVIRLFAVNAVLIDFALWVSALTRPMPFQRSMGDWVMHYGPATLTLVLIYWLWRLAPRIARMVTRGVETEVVLPGLTPPDLYRFAFVFLGLYFVLNSLADTINWLHYLVTATGTSGGEPRINNIYQFARALITLGAGLVSLLGAPRWTRKLLAYEAKDRSANEGRKADEV
jgi:hypothetical protein